MNTELKQFDPTCLNGRKIRLIAVDLDQTLLNNKKEITVRTWNALRRARAAGIQIVPATGRGFHGLPQDLMDFCDYAILMNGAMGVKTHPKQVLFDFTFTKKETLYIYDKLWETFHRPISVFLDGNPYMQEDQKPFIQTYELPDMAEFLYGNRIAVPDIREKINSGEDGAEKIGILHYITETDPAKVITAVKGLAECSVKDTGDSFDLNPKGVDKGSGLRRLAENLEISVGETMAFGDAGNDIPMLQTAGIGICMENGCEEAKAASDYMTVSNEADGVAEVIEKLLYAL